MIGGNRRGGPVIDVRADMASQQREPFGATAGSSSTMTVVSAWSTNLRDRFAGQPGSPSQYRGMARMPKARPGAVPVECDRERARVAELVRMDGADPDALASATQHRRESRGVETPYVDSHSASNCRA